MEHVHDSQTKKSIRPFTVRRCRAGGRHQVTWCFGFCKPVKGKGLCGREAPHGLKSEHQVAMAEYARRNQAKISE